MTTTDINLPVPVQGPDRLGQGTAVEMSRAVAEVYAAVMMARQAPRNVQAAIRAMEQSCKTPELANVAFYSYRRGSQAVNQPSVHLARELGRCWGNLHHGVSELRRDDEHGQSEMQAVAWDLETNTRVAAIFIQPHLRDKTGGTERLTGMRDIYESNANAGARRVRQAIFAVLPHWYVEQAKALCRHTMEHGGGVPLPQRIANAIAFFAELRVTEDDLAAKLDRPPDKWTPQDLADLTVLHTSIKQGTITREEAFPPADKVTAAALAESPDKPTPAPVEPPARTSAPRPEGTDPGAWHDRGHTTWGSTARRDAWHPECAICTARDGGQAGEVHYYNHKEPVSRCAYCDQETAWATAGHSGQEASQ